jgi:hypothetical protein
VQDASWHSAREVYSGVGASSTMDLSGALDVWFRPKGFESERLYKRLGALLIKRYVPTGGDLVMHGFVVTTPTGAG